MWKYENGKIVSDTKVIGEIEPKHLDELLQMIDYANAYGLLLQDLIQSLGIVGLQEKKPRKGKKDASKS